MEFSSPLAAMRPHPVPAWGNRKDLGMGRCSGWNTVSSTGSYDFKAMSMFQQQPKSQPQQRKPQQQQTQQRDYFNMKPVQRSSPTSSLTADLDANFHIESSPQVPTPRRSLFTANIFRPTDETDRLTTPPIETEGATTPPIPSSSPGIDGMDISPLPHKAPYFVAQVTLPSPTPEESPNADESMTSPNLLCPDHDLTPVAPPVLAPTFLPVPERRRPVTRPSLSRSKGYSMNNIPVRPSSAENQLPPFRFGAIATNGLQCSSTPSLLETYSESPVEQQEHKPFSASSMMPPPPRRTSLSNGSRHGATGSPSACHIRKPSQGRPPLSRPPRKQMRRSLSMFQHPDDVMKEEEEAYEQPTPTLASVMDVDVETSSTPKLPHFIPDDEPDSLPRITRESMVDILDGKYNDSYDQISIIDCRFEYEYNGGHIDGAVNFNDKTNLADKLFGGAHSTSTLLIFHCEYSVHRAPLTAKYIRNHDRTANVACYPHLTFPEMYILDGGYSKFFNTHPAKCYPQSYVEMNDHRHEEACEAGMAKVKQQRRAPLNRAQTFAFGQNCHDLAADGMEDSPTAGGARGGLGARTHSALDMGFEFDGSPSGFGMGGGRASSFARRMASY